MAIHPVERLIHSWFWITGTVLIAMIGLLYGSITKLYASSQWVDQTYQAIKDIADIRAEYSRAESAQRGYIISSNNAYSVEYREALGRIGKSLTSLKLLTRNSSAQQQRLTRLEAILEERLGILEELVRLRETERSGKAWNQIVASVSRQQARPAFFGLLAQLEHEERRLLEVRREDEMRHSRVALLILATVILICLVALAPAYFATIKQTRARQLAEALERESNDLLRLTLDAVQGMFFYVDRNGRFRFHNKAFAQLVQFKDKPIVGATVRDVLDTELYRTVESKHREVMQGHAVHYELRRTLHDGKLADIDVHYVPHFGVSGGIQGFFGMLLDITDRKQEEVRLQRIISFQQAVLQITDFSMIAIDTSGIIQFFNAGAEKNAGLFFSGNRGQDITCALPC